MAALQRRSHHFHVADAFEAVVDAPVSQVGNHLHPLSVINERLKLASHQVWKVENVCTENVRVVMFL
jgi:hypothetical protein